MHSWTSVATGMSCPLHGCLTLCYHVRQVEPHKSSGAMRGYIAMLVVQKPYRGAGTGTMLYMLCCNWPSLEQTIATGSRRWQWGAETLDG